MKKFKYKARDKSGRLVTGEVEASTPEIAASLLRKKGLLVISITKTSSLMPTISKYTNRVSAKDVALFTRQLATMINAGLPVIEALSILRVQSGSSFGNVLTQIEADVGGGESFSNALSRHPRVFSPSYVALVKAGETGGVLDKVLVRLADDLERQQEFKGKVKGALIYPAIIVVGMIIVFTIMIVFVIPKLTELYTQFDAELPLTTRIITGFSAFIIRFWPIIISVIVFSVWGFYIYKKTKRGKRRIEEIIFKTPIIGPLRREIILTELSRTLSLMIGAGVPILDSLSITANVIKSEIISDAVNDVANQVEKGFPIAYSFAKHPDAFPYILSQMIAVGEETGKMDEVLAKVSHVFEVNSEQKVKALTTAIEPIVMVVLGLGVAFLVVSVIIPIYNLTTVI